MMTTSPLSTRPGFLRIINDKTFDIEFHGYLSNHAKHAIIALEKLGASDERVDEYWNGYTTLTPYNLKLHKIDEPWQNIKPCTQHEWSNLRGTKKNWPGMCQFMEHELNSKYDGNVNNLVKAYAPDLLPGLTGSLTHGIIHLGWALDAVDSRNPWMIIEGLAYLNFCFVSVHPENFISSAFVEDSAVESITRVAQTWKDENLAEMWVSMAKRKYDESSGFHPELIPAGFQWELSKVLQEQHEIAYRLPSWLDTKSVPEIFEELYKLATLLYLGTTDPSDGHGNFLVLHLITSLWGLEHVSNVIEDDEVSRQGLKCYYSSLVCLLATSPGGFPSPEVIKAKAAEVFGDSKSFDEDPKHLEATIWPGTVAKGIKETEEHNIKLVYVCRELWRRYGHWKAFRIAAETFTVTPNIGPRPNVSSFKG